jgi:hypothetical protein
MVSYIDIKELEKTFLNKDSINVIKTTIYIFISFIIIYIFIDSILTH